MTEIVVKRESPTLDGPALKLSNRPAALTGLCIVLLLVVVFGGWAATAPLDSAVLAPGALVVEGYRKTIQHPEGGVVAQLKVRDGDAVEAGELLILLDDTQIKAELEIVRSQLTSLKVTEARLVAERDGIGNLESQIELTAGDRRMAEAFEDEQAILSARLGQLHGERGLLEQQVVQLEEQVTGLNAVIDSKRSLLRSYHEEIKELSVLLNEGYIDKMRLRDLRRKADALEGENSEHRSGIAGIRLQQNEARMKMLQLENAYRSEAVDTLAQVRVRIADLQERLIALQHRFERSAIRAPVSGMVLGLAVHTVGGVIEPGRPVMDIVPSSQRLVIEARVSPVDIDRVTVGKAADIRFSAFKAATTPIVVGWVTQVSPDRLRDQDTGLSYYLIRVEAYPDSLAALDSSRLLPGMPAEVLVNTGARTLLEYLLQPAENALARSLIED